MDIAELRAILSAAFILFGAAVFYIASLVSGHNIYKDLEYKVAILITLIVGLTLFIFSPLCFVILFPGLFCLGWSTSLSPTNPIDKFCCPSSSTIHTVNIIHELILGHLLGSFVLAATGLGLIFGCCSAITARSSILHWIRSRTGLKYPIYTYGLTWDLLLRRVKSHGRIQVKVGEETIDGELLVSSIKEEPKQIILKNYRRGKPGATSPENHPIDGDLLVTEYAKISEIHVPAESFNPNRDMFSHSTQALYSACAALGFVLLALSFKITARFQLETGFLNLSTCYAVCAGIWLAIAAAVTWIAIRLSRTDFVSPRTAFYLSPFVSFILLSDICLIFGGAIGMIGYFRGTSLNTTFYVCAFSFCLIFISGTMLYVIKRRENIMRSFFCIISQSGIHKIVVKEVFNAVYLAMDFVNIEQTKKWISDLLQGVDNDETYSKILTASNYRKRLAPCVDDCRRKLPLLFSKLNDLIIKEHFDGDEINALLFFNDQLSKHAKRLENCRVMPDRLPVRS